MCPSRYFFPLNQGQTAKDKKMWKKRTCGFLKFKRIWTSLRNSKKNNVAEFRIRLGWVVYIKEVGFSYAIAFRSDRINFQRIWQMGSFHLDWRMWKLEFHSSIFKYTAFLLGISIICTIYNQYKDFKVIGKRKRNISIMLFNKLF